MSMHSNFIADIEAEAEASADESPKNRHPVDPSAPPLATLEHQEGSSDSPSAAEEDADAGGSAASDKCGAQTPLHDRDLHDNEDNNDTRASSQVFVPRTSSDDSGSCRRGRTPRRATAREVGGGRTQDTHFSYMQANTKLSSIARAPRYERQCF